MSDDIHDSVAYRGVSQTISKRVDVAAALARGAKKIAIDFVLPGLPAGVVGILSSPGATGKSIMALMTAAAVACGIDPPQGPVEPAAVPGPVLIIAGEDGEEILFNRLIDLRDRYSDEQLELISQNLQIAPTVGSGLNILVEACSRALQDHIDALRPRLVIVDTLSRIHEADENSNADMGRVLRRFEAIAKLSGTAILILHHVSKAAALNSTADQQQSARGATVIVDNARYASTLSTMTKDEAECYADPDDAAQTHTPTIETLDTRRRYVRLSVPKTNYAAQPADLWFRRDAGGILTSIILTQVGQLPTKKKQARNGKRKQRVLDEA